MVSRSQFTLAEIESLADAVLDLGESIPRPLHGRERGTFHWLVAEYESRPIKAARHKQRLARLRALLFPTAPVISLDEYIEHICPATELRSALREHLLDIVATHKRCPKCSGLGAVNDVCASCKGSGGGSGTCPKCRGSGNTDGVCANCKGSGKSGLTHEQAIALTIRHFGPASRLSLDQLAGATVAFLDIAEMMGNRPLIPKEIRAWRWVLDEYETAGIKAAFLGVPEEQKEYYWGLMAQLRELLDPDPVEQLRLQGKKPTAVAQMHGGNYSTIKPMFQGVSVRRMNAGEVAERITLMERLCQGLAVLARELSLVLNSDRPEAVRIVKLVKRVRQRGLAFASRCAANPAIPPEPTDEEVLDHFGQMSRLKIAQVEEAK